MVLILSWVKEEINGVGLWNGGLYSGVVLILSLDKEEINEMWV